jgi:hypothetical protein
VRLWRRSVAISNAKALIWVAMTAAIIIGSERALRGKHALAGLPLGPIGIAPMGPESTNAWPRLPVASPR